MNRNNVNITELHLTKFNSGEGVGRCEMINECMCRVL